MNKLKYIYRAMKGESLESIVNSMSREEQAQFNDAVNNLSKSPFNRRQRRQIERKLHDKR